MASVAEDAHHESHWSLTTVTSLLCASRCRWSGSSCMPPRAVCLHELVTCTCALPARQESGGGWEEVSETLSLPLLASCWLLLLACCLCLGLALLYVLLTFSFVVRRS